MATVRLRSVRDETGLVGKLIALWLLTAVLVVLLVVDAASIVLSRVRMADVARDASAAGAATLAEGGGRRAARRAVLATITDRDEDALAEAIRIAEDGTVTVTVFDRAGTVLVGRFGLFESLAEVTVTDSSQPRD